MTEATVSAQVSAVEPKTKLAGKVVKTTLAGVLVDIGQELPGVIHISQLQKEQINKPEDVVQIGQTVEVWVRRIKKDRIELFDGIMRGGGKNHVTRDIVRTTSLA